MVALRVREENIYPPVSGCAALKDSTVDNILCGKEGALRTVENPMDLTKVWCD